VPGKWISENAHLQQLTKTGWFRQSSEDYWSRLSQKSGFILNLKSGSLLHFFLRALVLSHGHQNGKIVLPCKLKSPARDKWFSLARFGDDSIFVLGIR
jgi:hypothetical protein